MGLRLLARRLSAWPVAPPGARGHRGRTAGRAVGPACPVFSIRSSPFSTSGGSHRRSPSAREANGGLTRHSDRLDDGRNGKVKLFKRQLFGWADADRLRNGTQVAPTLASSHRPRASQGIRTLLTNLAERDFRGQPTAGLPRPVGAVPVRRWTAPCPSSPGMTLPMSSRGRTLLHLLHHVNVPISRASRAGPYISTVTVTPERPWPIPLLATWSSRPLHACTFRCGATVSSRGVGRHSRPNGGYPIDVLRADAGRSLHGRRIPDAQFDTMRARRGRRARCPPC